MKAYLRAGGTESNPAGSILRLRISYTRHLHKDLANSGLDFSFRKLLITCNSFPALIVAKISILEKKLKIRSPEPI